MLGLGSQGLASGSIGHRGLLEDQFLGTRLDDFQGPFATQASSFVTVWL